MHTHLLVHVELPDVCLGCQKPITSDHCAILHGSRPAMSVAGDSSMLFCRIHILLHGSAQRWPEWNMFIRVTDAVNTHSMFITCLLVALANSISVRRSWTPSTLYD